MYGMNILVSNSLPSLLSWTRNSFQRSVPPLLILKVVSPFLRNLNTCDMNGLWRTTNKGADSVRNVPRHSSRFVNVNMSSRALFSTSPQIDLKQKFTTFKTVTELLDLFETSRTSLDINECVNILHTIARIVWKDAFQRIDLQKHRGSSQQGCSVFKDLLNHIADNVTKLDKKHKDDIIWSLDKIQETNHHLYQMANE